MLLSCALASKQQAIATTLAGRLGVLKVELSSFYSIYIYIYIDIYIYIYVYTHIGDLQHE